MYRELNSYVGILYVLDKIVKSKRPINVMVMVVNLSYYKL